MFVKRFGLNPGKRLENYKVENVICIEMVRIKSDVTATHTENRIKHNKPDLLIHELKTNCILLIEVGVRNKKILAKWRKYELLACVLKPKHKATVSKNNESWKMYSNNFRFYIDISFSIMEKLSLSILLMSRFIEVLQSDKNDFSTDLGTHSC